ncbi:MAG: DUF4019 domain-containing protein, partial [Arenimonas sp.]|nr:DUF4019 domain-containing protein [Arenimonas sp.]
MKILTQALFLVFALSACTVNVGSNQQDNEPINVGTTEQQKSVIVAAHATAELLDKGQFDELWEQSGPMLTNLTNRTAFATSMKAMRAPFGAPSHRE